jgi:hypothetical protein
VSDQHLFHLEHVALAAIQSMNEKSTNDWTLKVLALIYVISPFHNNIFPF